MLKHPPSDLVLGWATESHSMPWPWCPVHPGSLVRGVIELTAGAPPGLPVIESSVPRMSLKHKRCPVKSGACAYAGGEP